MSEQKRAKIYTDSQLKQLLNHMTLTKYPLRNKVIVLFSAKAGLRACEIAGLSWQHVLNNECTDINDSVSIPDRVAKGLKGGRRLQMSDCLIQALRDLYASHRRKPGYDHEIVLNQQSYGMTGRGITMMFYNWFRLLGWKGYSSHSGRRTFITNCARKISSIGGSMQDVRILAGHSCLSVTQRYIDPINPDMLKKLVNMI